MQHAFRYSLLVALLATAACSPGPDASGAGTSQAQARARHLPTQAQVERFLAEGADPTLRKLSVADYWLHYKLMQATGIEQALGGETRAIAALQAIGDAYERKLRGAEADMPKLVPAAFTGEGMASGFTGMGMGGFLGLMSGGMLSGGVSRMSDQQLAELVAAGPIKFDGKGGSGEVRIDKDGSLSQAMEFEVDDHGLNGKVRMTSRIGLATIPSSAPFTRALSALMM